MDHTNRIPDYDDTLEPAAQFNEDAVKLGAMRVMLRNEQRKSARLDLRIDELTETVKQQRAEIERLIELLTTRDSQLDATTAPNYALDMEHREHHNCDGARSDGRYEG